MQATTNNNAVVQDHPLTLSRSVHSMNAARALRAIGPSSTRTFRDGEHVFFKGAEKRYAYIVLQGLVSTYSMLSNGHRQIINFSYPGDILDLDPLEYYTHSATATGDVEISCIPLKAITRRLNNDAEFARILWQHASSKLAFAHERLVALGAQTSPQRLAGFLLESASIVDYPAGSHAPDIHDRLITLPMKRQDIADYLGMTIETVSRNFTRMKRLGIVKCISPTSFLIANPALLMDVANGSTSFQMTGSAQ